MHRHSANLSDPTAMRPSLPSYLCGPIDRGRSGHLFSVPPSMIEPLRMGSTDGTMARSSLEQGRPYGCCLLALVRRAGFVLLLVFYYEPVRWGDASVGEPEEGDGTKRAGLSSKTQEQDQVPRSLRSRPYKTKALDIFTNLKDLETKTIARARLERPLPAGTSLEAWAFIRLLRDERAEFDFPVTTIGLGTARLLTRLLDESGLVPEQWSMIPKNLAITEQRFGVKLHQILRARDAAVLLEALVDGPWENRRGKASGDLLDGWDEK